MTKLKEGDIIHLKSIPEKTFRILSIKKDSKGKIAELYLYNETDKRHDYMKYEPELIDD